MSSPNLDNFKMGEDNRISRAQSFMQRPDNSGSANRREFSGALPDRLAAVVASLSQGLDYRYRALGAVENGYDNFGIRLQYDRVDPARSRQNGRGILLACDQYMSHKQNSRGTRDAVEESSQKRICRVTHPFHPLFGREIEIVTLRHNWKDRRVYYHNSRGRLDSISFDWTSCYTPDPAVEISGGRSLFLVADLLELAGLIHSFRKENGK